MAYPLVNRNHYTDLNYFDFIGHSSTFNRWRDGYDGEYMRYLDATQVLMYNSYGPDGDIAQPNKTSGLQSRFKYPPNPVICLAIIRNAPPAVQTATMDLSTNIWFGYTPDTSFVLNIPYEHPPSLYVRHAQHTNNQFVRIQQMGGGDSPIRLGDMSYRGEASPRQLWIAAMAGGIAVSEDAFESVRFFPLRWWEPTAEDPYGSTVWVPGAPVAVTHNAGQWALCVSPVKMPPLGVIQGPVEETPYDIVGPWYYTIALPSLLMRHQPVRDSNGVIFEDPDTGYKGIVVGECTLNPNGLVPDSFSRIPADRMGYEWRATINAVQSTSSFVGSGGSTANPSTGALSFVTMVSPLLFDVIYRQPAICQAAAAGTPSAKAPKSFTIQRGDQLTATGSVEIDNQLGQEKELAGSEMPRPITAMGYALDPDGVTIYPEEESSRALLSGYAIPRSSAEEGKSTLQMDFYGVGQLLADGKRLSDTFPLDGLGVWHSLLYAVAWAGIRPVQCNFENLGTYLNAGPWDKELYWYTDSAENLVNLIEEICVYDWNAHFWEGEDGRLWKGCRWCRTLRTPSDVATHFGAGAASPGCLAADLLTAPEGGGGVHFKFFTGTNFKNESGVTDTNYGELIAIEKPSLDVENNYYNCVRVKGPVYGRTRDSQTFDYTDWYSVFGVNPHPDDWGYSLGRKKSLERTYGWAVTRALRQMVAYCLWDEYRVRPEYRTIVVPWLPEIVRGCVVRVYGNVAEQHGMTDKHYRVTGYSHAPTHRTRERATTLTLQFMRTAPGV